MARKKKCGMCGRLLKFPGFMTKRRWKHLVGMTEDKAEEDLVPLLLGCSERG